MTCLLLKKVTNLNKEILPYSEIHAIFVNVTSNEITVFNYELDKMWTQKVILAEYLLEEIKEESMRTNQPIVFPYQDEFMKGLAFIPKGKVEMPALAVGRGYVG